MTCPYKFMLCLMAGLAPLAASAQVTNLYHTNRIFVATSSTVSGVTTMYKLYQAATQLTEIVGVTNVIFDTNATKAVEYEGFAWGYESANAAWTSAVAVYQSYYMNHTNMIYDNVGWVKGTKEAYSTWGAYLWYLQNQIVFRSSKTNVWVSPTGGATGYFVKVYVGSIGDYPPMTNVVDVGPTNWAQITNFLGAAASTDVVYTANLDTYYQLLTTRLIENTQQLYGFDRYSDPYVAYKSVEAGRTDTVFTQIAPTDAFAQVFFMSTNIQAVIVSPVQASAATQVVSVIGMTNGASEIQANGGSTNGTRTGRIEVLTYNHRTNTVAIRVVHEENDDVQAVAVGTSGLATNTVVVSAGPNGFRDTASPAGDDVISANGLNILAGPNGVANTTATNVNTMSTGVALSNVIATLNGRVYNQAVFEWTVTLLPDMTVNYDLNRDGFVDVNSWMSAEMTVISNLCKDTGYAYNIFLVDHPSDGSFGYMSYGQPFGFVHGNTSPHIPTTIAHELGHGAFSFTHDLVYPFNIMAQGQQIKWRLFKSQWEIIQP